MSIMSRSVDVLASVIQATAGVECIYRRGIDEVFLTAIPSDRTDAGDVIEDAPMLDTDIEWILVAADLRATGKIDAPKPRDELEWIAEGGTRQRYVILPPTEGARCWEPNDHEGRIITVFAKERP